MGASRRGEREPGKSDRIDARAIARAVLREGIERSRRRFSTRTPWRSAVVRSSRSSSSMSAHGCYRHNPGTIGPRHAGLPAAEGRRAQDPHRGDADLPLVVVFAAALRQAQPPTPDPATRPRYSDPVRSVPGHVLFVRLRAGRFPSRPRAPSARHRGPGCRARSHAPCVRLARAAGIPVANGRGDIVRRSSVSASAAARPTRFCTSARSATPTRSLLTRLRDGSRGAQAQRDPA
jgi:hypothetical protein